MSHYSVIRSVTEKLQEILWSEFEPDHLIRQSVQDPSEIVFANPTDTARNSSNKLSLWLYQITENEFVKNQPLIRNSNSNGSSNPGEVISDFPPLALNLYYLVTPFTGDSAADQLLLGKTMQTFYNNAIVPLRSATNGETVAEELRIVFCRLTLEELTRIWEALQEPYRLSVCYQVRVTRIDAERQVGHRRIEERRADFADGVGTG